MGTAMFAPWEGSTTRSGDRSGPGADNTTNVLFTFGALSLSKTTRVVGTAVSVVSSWMVGESVGRIMVRARAMTVRRSNVGNKPGAICVALGVLKAGRLRLFYRLTESLRLRDGSLSSMWTMIQCSQRER